MNRDYFPERRRKERRRTNPTEDILCRRVFGDRRKQQVGNPVPNSLDHDPTVSQLELAALQCDNLAHEPCDAHMALAACPD